MTHTPTLRFPDLDSPEFMSRRAWWLLAFGILLPGSAQLLAGNRRLGRFAVTVTFVLWLLLLGGVLLYMLWRPAILTLATNVVVLWLVQAVLVLYALLLLVLGLNTIRLARLVRVSTASRVGVGVLAIAALVISAGGIGYAAVVLGTTRGVLERVFSSDQAEPPIDGRYNILLLGGDAGPDRVGLRPDSISVVSVDAATGAATIVGIPRNLEHVRFSEGSPLWGAFPEGYNCGDECLVSYLYTYGIEHPELYPDAVTEGSDPGVEAMRDAAEAVTGVTLQYYVLIDMQGFAELIDALGGITVDVSEPVTLGKNGDAPIGVIPAGVQHMDGPTALWYARSRYDTTDYARMERQRQVQEAIVRQADPANVLSRFQAVADAGAQVVKTDIPTQTLPTLIELAAKTRKLPITSLELIPENGFIPAYPDYELIHAAVLAAFASSTPTATPAS